jgi:hypothetical protein
MAELKSHVWCHTIATVTKVHCPCFVICCLAMDWEGLQGRFSWMDMRTLKKFHVFGGIKVLQVIE